MLVRVALDCDALKDTSTDQAAQVHKHTELIRLLRQHGVIVLSSDADVKRTIATLPDVNVRKLWQAAKPYLYWEKPDEPPAACLCYIQNYDQFHTIWSGKADVAIADTARAWVLGVPEDQPSHFDAQVDMEIVRFDLARAADAFVRVEDVNNRDLQKDEHRDTIWQERFKPLVMYTRRITICDRYAGERLRRYYNNQQRESGLRWVLHHISQCSPSYLDLILGAKPDTRLEIIEDVEKMVRGLPGSGVQDLKLTIVPDHHFGENAHDRHIRFQHHSVSIGRGLEIFEESTQTQSSSCHLTMDNAKREREHDLKQMASDSDRDRIIKSAA